jgi:hypothetical protein
MGRHQSYTWIKNWSESIAENINSGARETLNNPTFAKSVAENILQEVVTKHPKYNDWSGNMRRSYVVQISSREAYYLFKCNPSVSAKPHVVYSEDTTSEKADLPFFKLTRKLHGVNVSRKKGRVFRFRGRGKRKKDQYWRRLRPKFEAKIITYPEDRYQYLPTKKYNKTARTTTYNKLRTHKGDAGISIVVGNYTPYRKLVEKKYRVIDQKARERWKQQIQEEAKKNIQLVVKRVCYNANQKRDLKTGRFTK